MIAEFERGLAIASEDAEIEITRQYLIDYLIDKRLHSCLKSKNRKIEKQIDILTNLNISLENCENYKLETIKINGNKCKLAYDLTNGKQNHYIGGENLKTKECAILYKIMNEYGIYDVDISNHEES